MKNAVSCCVFPSGEETSKLPIHLPDRSAPAACALTGSGAKARRERDIAPRQTKDNRIERGRFTGNSFCEGPAVRRQSLSLDTARRQLRFHRDGTTRAGIQKNDRDLWLHSSHGACTEIAFPMYFTTLSGLASTVSPTP